MKILFLNTALLLSAVLVSKAQNKTTDKEISIGIKAGINVSRYHFSPTGYPSTDDLNNYQSGNVGFNATVFAEFGIAKNLSLQPGISLQTRGTLIKGKVLTGNETGEFKQTTLWTDIPINLVYKIPAGKVGDINIIAGPYIGVGISGRNKFKNVTPNGDTGNFKFGNDTGALLEGSRRIDYGANFGVGFNIASGLFVGANYGLGLGNLVPKSLGDGNFDNGKKWKQTNRNVGFSVGYIF